MARITMPATWRWCAARSRKFRWCWLPRRPRSNRKSMRGAAATAHVHLPERFGGAASAVDRGDRHAHAKVRRAGASSRRGSPKPCRSRSRRSEQALLFLNRRGYAPLTLCRACGFRLQCPNCDAWLVDHRFKRRLVCHHCGFSMPPPAECPKCHATESFAAVGPGVERLEQEAAELFPDSAHFGAVERSGRVGRAPAPGARRCGGRPLRSHHRHATCRQRATISPSSIWSASSMPISGLGNGDPRAAERTFQLLHQVVGRAGREEGRGVGYLADASARASGDARADLRRPRGVLRQRDRAARAHAAIRRSAGSPALSSPPTSRHAAEAYGRTLANAAPKDEHVRVLAPAEAPIAVVRGRHRFRLLVKSPRPFRSLGLFARMARRAPKPRGNVRLEVDVDPQSFY